jgi:argininosuccinate lyase
MPKRHVRTALSVAATLAATMMISDALAEPQSPLRDEFFWLSEINKATAVINTQEGLLDKDLAPRLARGIAQVIADGAQPGAERPRLVIKYEPLLIKAAGPEVTLLHAGRSSQDMHATYNAAILRDNLLALAEQHAATMRSLLRLAGRNTGTILPNYTNGVAAQPNSYAHQLLGHFAGMERDAQRLREAYTRIDRCAMGTTVLNGTSWPLNRSRMADYLGFAAIVDNAYDASQISSMDEPVELGQIIVSMALRAGNFIEDTMTQYAQPRPWILLREGEGTTYVSSAMPQKRNPGLLNDTRRDASTAMNLGMGPGLRMHNITPGMVDPKSVKDNAAMVAAAIGALKGWDKILNSLVVDPDRALEELNRDWTASQELADVLMRKYKLPFRVGHHFASEVVGFAKAHDLKPLDFPYAEAKRIYREAVKDYDKTGKLPMSEAEFRATLNPKAIVANRATVGGPQPAELDRMLKDADRKVAEQDAWIQARRARIDASLARLDADFDKLLASGK